MDLRVMPYLFEVEERHEK